MELLIDIRNEVPSISDLRTFGLANLRTTEPSDYRTFGLPNLRTTEPSDYRTIGLPNLRTTEPSDYRTFGLSNLRTREPSATNLAHSFCSEDNVYMSQLLIPPYAAFSGQGGAGCSNMIHEKSLLCTCTTICEHMSITRPHPDRVTHTHLSLFLSYRCNSLCIQMLQSTLGPIHTISRIKLTYYVRWNN